jgi:hypothetical protein
MLKGTNLLDLFLGSFPLAWFFISLFAAINCDFPKKDCENRDHFKFFLFGPFSFFKKYRFKICPHCFPLKTKEC